MHEKPQEVRTPPSGRVVMAALALLAGEGAIGPLSGFRPRHSRTNCAACGADIPPGRPGRRCPPCRQPRAIEARPVCLEIVPPAGGEVAG